MKEKTPVSRNLWKDLRGAFQGGRICPVLSRRTRRNTGIPQAGHHGSWRGRDAALQRDGDYVVCNGELYGFRQVKENLEEEGYMFESDSDCEIILPLYRKYGVDMFTKLDAEFAMVIYEQQEGLLRRGERSHRHKAPLYGQSEMGGMFFASEAGNLVGLTNKVPIRPPGHYYKDGEFHRYTDVTAVSRYCEDDIDIICENIREKLIAGVAKRLDSDAPLGFLLSGGLDSSLVCAIAQKLMPEKPIRTFAIGMEEDAIDLKYAAEAAEYIGSQHTEIIIDTDMVLSSLKEVIGAMGTFDITTIRAGMGMYLVCKAIRETTDVKVLLTGEISDELFGYKYTDFAPSPG